MKHEMLGSNIKSGVTPGGFSRRFGCTKSSYVPRKRNSSREVKEACNAFLEKRQLLNQPSFQDSTVFGGFSRR